MAISKNNLFLQGFSGRVGNVIVKQYKDKTVMTSVPVMRNRVLSEKENESREFMKYANFYARSINSNPLLKEQACRTLNVAPNKVYRAVIKEFLLRKGEVDDMIKIS